MFKYSIKNLGVSSNKYGVCEICKKHASEIYLQTEEKQYKIGALNGWTKHNCNDYFGHKECLIKKRR